LTKRNRVLVIILSVALLFSVVLNALLFSKVKAHYYQLNAIMLDPLGLSYYPISAEQVSEPQSSRQRVVFLGDSRAQSWTFPSGVEQFEFYNRGIGNQTSVQVLARFEEHVATLEPDVVVIQVGVNDLKMIPLFPESREEIIANCSANIEQMIGRSLELDAVVVLVTIFPLGEVPLERRLFWSEDVGVAIEEVNATISSLEQDGVVVLDSGVVLADESGQVRERYSQDLLHLSESGYEVLNEVLVPILNALP
jgi:lysophospholipase L1-like esterase